MRLLNLLFQGRRPGGVARPAVGSVSPFICAAILFLTWGSAYAADTQATPPPAGAQTTYPAWLPQFLGAQINANFQNVPGFHSPYSGANSFIFNHSFSDELTHTYGLYLGSQITSNLQLYLDIEMFRGSGVSGGYGLGGYTNADVIRAGPGGLGQNPYAARAYARYVIPLSNAMTRSLRGARTRYRASSMQTA